MKSEHDCDLHGHVPHGMSNMRKYPVRVPFDWRIPAPDEPVTVKIPPYYTVKWCRYCGLEELTLHNWPDNLPKPEGYQ